MHRNLGFIFLLLFVSGAVQGRMQSRLGSLLQFHGRSLSSFDSRLGGNPLLVGGIGCVAISDQVCIGGAGAASMVSNPKGSVSFGMGYGGSVVEYAWSSWLSVRAILGGGAYKVNRIISETTSQTQLEKIASGGFFVFHPSVHANWKVSDWLIVAGSVGYFVPSVSQLQSVTLGMNLIFG